MDSSNTPTGGIFIPPGVANLLFQPGMLERAVPHGTLFVIQNRPPLIAMSSFTPVQQQWLRENRPWAIIDFNTLTTDQDRAEAGDD